MMASLTDEDGAEALLALAQVRLRSLSIRDVAEETDAPDGVPWACRNAPV